MKLAFCPKCEKVAYLGAYHSGICSYCRSNTIDVKVRASPLYILGILIVVVLSLGVYFYEPLLLWQRALIMIVALISGYALVLRGLREMRLNAWQSGRKGRA